MGQREDEEKLLNKHLVQDLSLQLPPNRHRRRAHAAAWFVVPKNKLYMFPQLACCHSLSLHGIIVFLALAVCMPPSIFIGSLAMAAACPPPPPPPPSDGFGGGGPQGRGLALEQEAAVQAQEKDSDLMNQFDIKVHLKNFCDLTNFVFLN